MAFLVACYPSHPTYSVERLVRDSDSDFELVSSTGNAKQLTSRASHATNGVDTAVDLAPVAAAAARDLIAARVLS
jgi:hypothetical protein